MASLGGDLYTDAASFGKVMAYIGSAIGVVLGIGMVVAGIMAIRDANKIMTINNPKQQTHVLTRNNGVAMIGAGIFVILFSILWAWLATKYKFVAAMTGVRTAWNLF